MAIDLDALAREADVDGGDCVVTRRWLRQVLVELKEARRPRPAETPSLDYKTLERR